jgi:hypothetical protein
LFSKQAFSLATHSEICNLWRVSLCRARYWEPRQGLIVIRPTRAKSAITNESIPSFLSKELKEAL